MYPRWYTIGDATVKVYYAHSMVLYGTPLEKRDIKMLESMGFEVVNPSSKVIQERFAKWTEDFPDMSPMTFFKDQVKKCDAVVFRPHADGAIPAGVYEEIDIAKLHGMPVLEVPSGIHKRALSVAETREWLEQVGQR